MKLFIWSHGLVFLKSQLGSDFEIFRLVREAKLTNTTLEFVSAILLLVVPQLRHRLQEHLK